MRLKNAKKEIRTTKKYKNDCAPGSEGGLPVLSRCPTYSIWNGVHSLRNEWETTIDRKPSWSRSWSLVNCKEILTSIELHLLSWLDLFALFLIRPHLSLCVMFILLCWNVTSRAYAYVSIGISVFFSANPSRFISTHFLKNTSFSHENLPFHLILISQA